MSSRGSSGPELPQDARFMAEALELAARPQGATHPNPMVGALLVRDGEVVGRGYHPEAGRAHAEIFALRDAGSAAQGATLYVTLEPCNHQGRTPPCTEAILHAGVARVVVAMRDPNPLVAGRGLERLREGGLATSCGVLEADARRVNEAWLHWVGTGRPHVTIKAATTLDGWIATSTGDSRWISCPESRQRVMQLRSRVGAVMVGPGTLLADDPRLTARVPGARQPWRVGLDPGLRCPTEARILSSDGGRPLLFCSEAASAARERALRSRGAEVVRIPEHGGHLDLRAVLDELGRRDRVRLLVEGGGELIRALLDRDLVQRAWVFVSPRLLGGADGVPLGGRRPGARSIAEGWQFEDVEWCASGRDMLLRARPVPGGRPCSPD